MAVRKAVASRRRLLPNPIKQRVPHRENLTPRRHAFLPHRKQFLYHRPCLWKFLQNHAAYRFRIHICKVRVLQQNFFHSTDCITYGNMPMGIITKSDLIRDSTVSDGVHPHRKIAERNDSHTEIASRNDSCESPSFFRSI